MDPMLAIYLEEFSELVEAFDQTTQTLLENPEDGNAFADAERQLHTIKGGARMTELPAIGDLSYAGESLLELVVKGKVDADSKLLETLRILSDKLSQMYDLAAKGSEIDPADQLIEELHALSSTDTKPVTNGGIGQVDEPKLENEVKADKAETEVSVNLLNPEMDLSLDEDPFSSNLFSNDSNSERLDGADSKAIDDSVADKVKVTKNTDESEDSVDPMVAIYLEELDELVEAFDVTTQRLIENPEDADAISDAERQLHTIKGGARMTGLLEIGDLSHAGESLLNLVGSGKVSADKSLLDKLQLVSDELFLMNELAAKGSEIKPVTKLIEELKLLSGEEVQSAEISSDTEEMEAQEVKGESLIDDPMLAIYLEELSELVQAFDNTTQQLIKNIEDTDAIGDAERQLHTIKGGARMTNMAEIADLSHAGESLLNLVVNKKVKAEKELLEKLQLLSDTLFKMYDAAVAGQTVTAETDLIGELNRLSGQDSDEKNDSFVSVNTNQEIETSETSLVVKQTKNQQAQTQSSTESLTSSLFMPDFKMAEKGASELESALAGAADDLAQRQEKLLPVVVSPLVGKPEEDTTYTSSIRVPIGLINQLITSTNEWGHKNIRLTEQYEESGKVVAELKRTSNRLKEQIRNLELEADSLIHAGGSTASLPKLKDGFDPLELDEYTDLQQNSRSLAESLEDLMSLSDSLEMGLKSAEKTSASQERACKSVQEDLITTRMTKVTGLLTRLKRIVRQVSSELGKEVSLKIADENCEMDRTILERITASLEHLIRNALAHGIESPEERIAAGKPSEGKITLKIDREGPEIVIILEDDGAGINVEKLKAASIKKGLIEASSNLSDKEVFQLILMSGISTAEKVSQVSGRGVGMDVVNSEVNALGGNITIDSEFGKFTRFTLSVPYNLATNQVMFLDVAGEVLAVPVAKLEGMQRLSVDDVNSLCKQQEPTLESGGHTYSLRYLGQTLGLDRRTGKREVKVSMPLIMLEENGHRVAYIVDEIRGNREVMLKPLGPLFEESRLLSSASILGGGEIVLLLNAHELIRLGIDGKTLNKRKVDKMKDVDKKKTIMVVDDSITVRKITENLLLSYNFAAVTANDGINALEVLEDETPDLILLDIEMPRMDGFELLENIRNSKKWKDIPVIMISSRSGAKHRQHADKLGANGFIGKPWEAKQLAMEINNCLNKVVEEAVV